MCKVVCLITYKSKTYSLKFMSYIYRTFYFQIRGYVKNTLYIYPSIIE